MILFKKLRFIVMSQKWKSFQGFMVVRFFICQFSFNFAIIYSEWKNKACHKLVDHLKPNLNAIAEHNRYYVWQ